jgi:SAM-dependent methyltransferase
VSSRLRRQTYRRVLEEAAIWERWRSLSGGIVLDYGCGTGWFGGRLLERGFRVLGLEVQREFLQEARSRADGDRALLVFYAGGTIPLKKESVDLILAVGVVRSLMDRGPLDGAVEEWRRCLRSHGRLLLIETDNAALRRKIKVEGIKEVLTGQGFQVLAWHPIRKTSWWGLGLVKAGLLPFALYARMAGWELRRRKEERVHPRCKMAYMGEFLKS